MVEQMPSSDSQYCTGVPGVEQCHRSELQDCTVVQGVDQWPGSV